MRPHPLILAAVFLWNVMLPDVQGMSIVTSCSTACAEESRAKSECVIERNCLVYMFSENIDEFANCAQPCTKIGNCFQRCALGADVIKQECEELCDGITTCFDDCYNHRINMKMNRVFTKRP